MCNSYNKKHELRQFSRYKALTTARYCLLTMLLLLIFYFGYYGYSLVPFYLFMILALWPSLVIRAFSNSDKHPCSLSYVKKKLGYSRAKHLSNLFSFYLTLVLCFLWNLRYLSLTEVAPVLKIAPAIPIISSLLIYTIGQYVYFKRYDSYLMKNELEKIQ